MENKNILITGCSSGMGYQTALKFAQSGYKTFASVRNIQSEGAKKLLQIATNEKLPLELIQIDVSSDESVKSGITNVLQTTDHIDILVNNAGFGYLGPIEDFEIDEIHDQYETNIFGVLRMVKAVAPIMRKNGSGLIVNISSIVGLVPFPLFSVYSSSKYAIETLSEGLRFELAHFGIKVVLVEPGSFLTSFANNRKHPKQFNAPDSPYKTLVETFFGRYQKTHDKAKVSFLSKVAEPQKVVDLIYKIAHTDKPKIRYIIGYDAQMFLFLRRVLPEIVWEWLLRFTYKW